MYIFIYVTFIAVYVKGCGLGVQQGIMVSNTDPELGIQIR